MTTTVTVPLTIGEDGVIRVGKTRVTLDTVVYAFQDGVTAEEIASQYPSLDLADVYLVIAYYLKHKAEVETYLQKREKAIEEVRQLNESRFNPVGVRERLVSRQQALSRRHQAHGMAH
jgi:uncharacterized protein (DUF433 family)